MAEFASLVLFSGRTEQLAAFYRAVGVDLEYEDHGDGLRHLAADVGEAHFAIYDSGAAGDARGWREPGSSFPGFYVTSLDDTLVALAAQGTTVLVEHQVKDWGCRVVVQDPDGRAVEINQRGHCADQ
jgi:lactoylglutathione lyase